MNAHKLVLPTLIAMSVWAAPVSAQTVVSDPGTTFDADALTGFATTGDLMGGMSVTAFFGGGLSPATYTWGDLGGGLWGVSGLSSAFSLTLGGNTDTFSNPWSLTSTGFTLSRLVFDGVPGNTIFDRTAPSFGTSGSAQGRDFIWSGGDLWNTRVTYRNLVGVGGAAPVGDLYSQVDVAFGSDFTGSARFVMDTDNAVSSIVAVPEPGTFLLLLSGLGALAGLAFIRREGLEEYA